MEESFPCSASGYHVEAKIGRGAFSVVYKAVCIPKRMDVAIKAMELDQESTNFDEILEEIRTMRLSNHENLLRCYCSFLETCELWVVIQFMDKGSCLRILNKARQVGLGEGMNESWVAYVLSETLQGLEYLHHSDQMHRDIKAGNILIDFTGHVCLADFGVSGYLFAQGFKKRSTKTFVGTPCWMAPEVMEQRRGYNEKADIWSIGITALELAKGFAPYAHFPPMKVLVKTVEEDPPTLKSYSSGDKQRDGSVFSREFKSFVNHCLQKSPAKRQSSLQLLEHRFLRCKSKESFVNDLLSVIPSVGLTADSSVVSNSSDDKQMQQMAPTPMATSTNTSPFNDLKVDDAVKSNAVKEVKKRDSFEDLAIGMGAMEFNLTHSDDDESDDSGMGDKQQQVRDFKPSGGNVVNIIGGGKSGDVIRWVSENGVEASSRRRRTESGTAIDDVVDGNGTADFMDDFNDNVASEKTK